MNDNLTDTIISLVLIDCLFDCGSIIFTFQAYDAHRYLVDLMERLATLQMVE